MADYKPHVVRQGEHVAKLAFVRGADADEVWNHPSNADLRAKRSSMDVLYPGDVIHLPEGETKPLPLEKGSKNRYTAQIPRRTLTLALASTRGPYANEPYEIHGLPGPPDAPARKATTGPNGEVDMSVPITVREIGVFLPNPNLTYWVRVGDTDPIAEARACKNALRTSASSNAGSSMTQTRWSPACAPSRRRPACRSPERSTNRHWTSSWSGAANPIERRST